MKSGWKTTEFWLTVISSLITIWFGINQFIPPELVIKIVAIFTAIWTIARTLVKLTKTEVDDKFLNKIEDVFKNRNKKSG